MLVPSGISDLLLCVALVAVDRRLQPGDGLEALRGSSPHALPAVDYGQVQRPEGMYEYD